MQQLETFQLGSCWPGAAQVTPACVVTILLRLVRRLSNTYEDGRSEPRGGGGQSRLPSARTISAVLHHEPPNPNNVKLEDKTPHQFATHMLMQFGHFLGHDMTLTSQDELDCCHPNIVRQGETLPRSALQYSHYVLQRSRPRTL